MFRGFSTVSLDVKGRLAMPSRYRDRLAVICDNSLVLTPNPLDRCLWLYPLPEWEVIEQKLQSLSDFDQQSRRTKQMMRGYATDCELDGHGRLRIPKTLRDFAGLDKQVAVLGQGNKFEIWDEANWSQQRDAWLERLGEHSGDPSEPLQQLSL